MAIGDLTLTSIGAFQVSAAALKTAVDAVNLAAATDFLYIIPSGDAGMVHVLKVVRAAS